MFGFFLLQLLLVKTVFIINFLKGVLSRNSRIGILGLYISNRILMGFGTGPFGILVVSK